MVVSNRRLVNFLNIVITCSVIFVAVKVSDGSIAKKINDISSNLDRALNDVIKSGQEVNYTEYEDKSIYQSNATFNPKAMAGLYNITNNFMDLVMPKNISYVINLFMKDGEPNISADVLTDNWKDLLTHYWGLLTVLIVTLLVIIFMPFCGLCFCCCRCCGKCGARSQPSDKKHDLCKKVILATLLICLGTALLFGVVCAFVTSQQLHEGTNELTKGTGNSVNDVITFLDSVTKHFDLLLDTNFNEFNDTFCDTMKNGSNIVFTQLIDKTNATVLEDVIKLVDNLDNAKGQMKQMKELTNALRVYASQLNDALRKVKRDLLATLESCTEARFATGYVDTCNIIKANISDMHTQIDFNSLPELSSEIADLEKFNIDSLKNSIREGQTSLNELQTTITSSIQATFNQVTDKIKQAGREIETQRIETEKKINVFKDQVNNSIEPKLTKADQYIRDYEKYGYYVGLAISCVILFVTICIAVGLICGICGKRPDVYGDDCCNKGTGSQFLMVGVFLMFLFGTLFAIFVLPAFLVGTLSQRTVCDSLRNPDDHGTILAFVDNFWKENVNTDGINISISESLGMCHKNKSIYEVFGLANVVNITEISTYIDKYDISKILDTLNMDEVVNKLSNANILNEEAKESLNILAGLELNINFDKFIDELNFTLINVDLRELSVSLDNLIKEINIKDRRNTDLISQLELSKLHIDTYQTQLVEKITSNAQELINVTKTLQQYMNPDGQSFSIVVTNLTKDLETAQATLRNSANDIKEIGKEFSKAMVTQTQVYIDRIVNAIETDVGKCGPLSLAINGTLTATCDKILLPFNGFWFVLFWSTLLFIPIIIVSVKLASLYQKFSPYSGTPVETEYLYDAYAERDSIPLNSNRGKPNKKKNKKYKRYEDRNSSNNSNEIVPREYAGGSHNPDARYADMAPKHWEEFPAGGPPQYQRAPTEYERPPPYYYPGNGDHQ